MILSVLWSEAGSWGLESLPIRCCVWETWTVAKTRAWWGGPTLPLYYSHCSTAANIPNAYPEGPITDLCPETGFYEGFPDFPQSIRGNGGIEVSLVHDHFLPYPFNSLFINHFIIRRCTFWAPVSIVKQSISTRQWALTAMNVSTFIFWVVRPCKLVGRHEVRLARWGMHAKLWLESLKERGHK